jgi:hypothetical protein
MGKRNRRSTPLAERFWAKVNQNGPIPAFAPHLGPCWLWTASLKNGYGCISSGGARGAILYAHRLSYEMHGRSLPSGRSMHLDHLCRVTACVNPAHLELVSCGENVHRGYVILTVEERQKLHGYCRRGIHEMTPENTYRAPSNPTWQRCRQCVTDRLARNATAAGQGVPRGSTSPRALGQDAA